MGLSTLLLQAHHLRQESTENHSVENNSLSKTPPTLFIFDPTSIFPYIESTFLNWSQQVYPLDSVNA